MARFDFPKDFIWGAATAAFQIEGNTKADGRGESVWDRFCQRPGAIEGGHTGDPACDHYRRWEQDLDLIKALGLQSYRFSIAWPRVQPQGKGAFNEKGLAFYDKLVDGLLARGIRPNATLYHWDLPQALEDEGSWMKRDTALRYQDYAAAVAKRLGDRVEFWATFNEFLAFVPLGFEYGIHAPGRIEGDAAVAAVRHHVLLAHGLGMQALRQNVTRKDAKLGIVINPMVPWPQSNLPQHVQAAEGAWADVNDAYMLPMTQGRYPEAYLKAHQGMIPVQQGDLEVIKEPMDFVGINYYTQLRGLSDGRGGFTRVAPVKDEHAPDMPGWECFAAGMRSVLWQFHQRYKLPLYITENGMGLREGALAEDGSAQDPRRVEFLKRHLVELHRSLADGVDLRGYYHWSLMDNFEWAFGYNMRFGLIHIDYETQKRTPKASALWYRDMIKAGGFEAEAYPQLRSPLDRALDKA